VRPRTTNYDEVFEENTDPGEEKTRRQNPYLLPPATNRLLSSALGEPGKMQSIFIFIFILFFYNFPISSYREFSEFLKLEKLIEFTLAKKTKKKIPNFFGPKMTTFLQKNNGKQ
jgi:hypothetical protein